MIIQQQTPDDHTLSTLSPRPGIAAIRDSDIALSELMEGTSMQTVSMRNLSQIEISNLKRFFEAHAMNDRACGSPRADMLLTLTQFNVFRAIIMNCTLLDVSYQVVCADDSISPFYNGDTVEHGRRIPAALQPTDLQRSHSHHPWIDIVPIPRMRDNLILVDDLYDDDDVCIAMMGFCSSPQKQIGLLVWGDPWTVDNWEVTEEFARDWGWVIKGCNELLESTNRWRGLRGEEQLRLFP